MGTCCCESEAFHVKEHALEEDGYGTPAKGLGPDFSVHNLGSDQASPRTYETEQVEMQALVERKQKILQEIEEAEALAEKQRVELV